MNKKVLRNISFLLHRISSPRGLQYVQPIGLPGSLHPRKYVHFVASCGLQIVRCNPYHLPNLRWETHFIGYLMPDPVQGTSEALYYHKRHDPTQACCAAKFSQHCIRDGITVVALRSWERGEEWEIYLSERKVVMMHIIIDELVNN